ncbi:DUF1643 domain-containing protein [Methylorubrum populi]|uniref:DUF1643 domain-containing protein n=1 Tax=Methylorubrum populi TaxID=223967 RepID=UPI0031BAFC91
MADPARRVFGALRILNQDGEVLSAGTLSGRTSADEAKPSLMSAIISPCGLYRLRLERTLDMLGGPTIGFCLHNPSTADASRDDPTSRRGIGFARAWGASRLIYVNPWAGRATKPADLWSMVDPVGPENDRYIAEAATECAASGGFMVAAWGAVNPPRHLREAAQKRIEAVAALIRACGCDLKALGVTSDGSPRHPLYVRAETIPMPWSVSARP